MVRIIFNDTKFPLAHFRTKDTSGIQLFSIIWESIEKIERLGLKFVALTADGGSSNRNFFSYASFQDRYSYHTKNIYATEERYLFILLMCHI